MNALAVLGIDLATVRWEQTWEAAVIRSASASWSDGQPQTDMAMISVLIQRGFVDRRELPGGVHVFRVSWREDGELWERSLAVAADYARPSEIARVEVLTDAQLAEREDRRAQERELFASFPYPPPPDRREADDPVIVIALEWPRRLEVFLARTGSSAAPVKLKQRWNHR